MFLVASPCYGSQLFETGIFILSMESYLRNDIVSFKNIADLDSSNNDDTTAYLGIDYSLGFKSELKTRDSIFYLRLERNGPSD